MENNLLPEVEKKIITLRNQHVILDADVAELYGMQTKEIRIIPFSLVIHTATA